MPSRPKPQLQSRAESYRELAMQAINSVAENKSRAERFAEQGDTQIAAEYQQLATEATARARRYMVFADFARRNS